MLGTNPQPQPSAVILAELLLMPLSSGTGCSSIHSFHTLVEEAHGVGESLFTVSLCSITLAIHPSL